MMFNIEYKLEVYFVKQISLSKLAIGKFRFVNRTFCKFRFAVLIPQKNDFNSIIQFV